MIANIPWGRLIHLLVLGLLLGLQGRPALAEALPVSYLCQGLEQFSQLLASPQPWQPAHDGLVPSEEHNSPCWVRIEQLAMAPADAPAHGQPAAWLSFANLHVQRVEIELFNAHGQALGSARRLGYNRQALVSGQRASFIPSAAWHLPLYARISFNPAIRAIPGLAHQVQVSLIEPSSSLQAEQRNDLGNLAIAALLVASALLAIMFAGVLRDLDYLIYGLYAGVQALTVFAKSGLPFALPTASPLWLDVWSLQCLVSALSALLSVRFGRFLQHSRRTAWLAVAVAGGFVLAIPLAYLASEWAAASIFVLLPLHFAVLLSGNWRGWRQGQRNCAILLFGLLPISLYWLTFFAYNIILKQPMPSALAIGSVFDVVRTLALPAAFCYGLVEQTLKLQQKTTQQARHDSLTQLYSREGLRHYGQDLIDKGRQPSVLMLNIERFKAINETLGMALGDQILIETGRRLRSLSRQHPGARVGRMHADQFCMLYPRAERLEHLRQQINQSFSRPTEVDGQTVDIALTGGIALPAEPRQDMTHLLRNAEIALDAARSEHRTWVEYHPELESSQRADLSLLSELKRAVEQDELRLYLQPKVRLQDGHIGSAEALVRWYHPQRGVIPPGDFVPFAEKTGRITLLTRWMLSEAMRLTSLWRRQQRPLQISVNLSAFDLGDQHFVATICRLLSESGADPADIRLEVTESAAMRDPDAALAVMNALHQAGFSLSIDDFGTGYSSLAYLQKMPAEELKIDRSFIRHVRPGSEAAALLESTISLGHRLGLSLVGEGAETAEEWAMLSDLGCDYAQGWFAAKPMPVSDFFLWWQLNSPFRVPPATPPNQAADSTAHASPSA